VPGRARVQSRARRLNRADTAHEVAPAAAVRPARRTRRQLLHGNRTRTIGLMAALVVLIDLVRRVFDPDAQVVPDPVSGTPMVVPTGRHAKAALGRGS
jgi:hypothetical protein